eukprot:2430270-Rhodomonas_salina.1
MKGNIKCTNQLTSPVSVAAESKACNLQLNWVGVGPRYAQRSFNPRPPPVQKEHDQSGICGIV